MDTEQNIEKIRQIYLDDYKREYRVEKRILLFEKLIKESEQYGLDGYVQCFEGYLKWVKKEYEAAIEHFEKSITLDENIAYPWHGLGNVYYDLKEYEKSIECDNKAISIDENFAYPWNGLGIVYDDLKEYEKAVECYNKAVSIDENFASPWNGLGIVYNNLKEYEKAIECCNKAISIDENFTYPWNWLGNIYRNLKEYEKAVECYEKNISLDENDKYPWHGLGNAYRDLKEYEKAVECYNKAVSIDENFAYPWNGLGIVYADLKEYKKAVECYNKAISIDENFASPWNGLGIVYKNLKEYEKAVECYNKSISIDENFAHAHRNLGLLLQKREKYSEAETSFNKALELFKKEKDDYYVSIVESELENIQKLINSKEALDEEAPPEKDDPVHKILKATIDTGIQKRAIENKKNFLSFLNEKTEKKDNSEYFQVLRRWNSYTPIIADNYHISKGGGYFLKTKNKGIVIDPGFNFIDNFKGAKHSFHEIDAVITSHAHNDHTSDIESILTLLFKYNQEIKESSDPEKNSIRNEIAKSKKMATDKVSQKELDEEYYKSPRRKVIDFYITISVYKKYSGLFELFSKSDYNIHIIEKGDTIKIDDVSIEIIGAKHHDIISDRDSIGIAVFFDNSVIIYTGDTGWSNEIEEQYKELADKLNNKNKLHNKNKLLVAHLGGFKEYERNYLIPHTDEDKVFYKYHLGRLGLAKVNEIIEPDICFISEFGEELKGKRIEVAEIFQDAFENKIIFLPADIGLKYNLPDGKIEAVTEVNADDNKLGDPHYVEAGEIKCCLLRKDYSLHYYQESSVKEADLVQVLGKQFEESTK
ncbi:MAG: tetratricopeptide repeat protein [Desulfobacteraceae bacterium]|nr:tetratricopeptide repeat protein [Desulfobacteraceae bacterium]